MKQHSNPKNKEKEDKKNEFPFLKDSIIGGENIFNNSPDFKKNNIELNKPQQKQIIH